MFSFIVPILISVSLATTTLLISSCVDLCSQQAAFLDPSASSLSPYPCLKPSNPKGYNCEHFLWPPSPLNVPPSTCLLDGGQGKESEKMGFWGALGEFLSLEMGHRTLWSWPSFMVSIEGKANPFKSLHCRFIQTQFWWGNIRWMGFLLYHPAFLVVLYPCISLNSTLWVL